MDTEKRKYAARYTAEEDDFLKQNWYSVGYEEAARRLMRPASSVRERVRYLRKKGLFEQRLRVSARFWQDWQDAYLKKQWGLRPDSEIGGRLGRTIEACRLRAGILGVSRRQNRRWKKAA